MSLDAAPKHEAIDVRSATTLALLAAIAFSLVAVAVGLWHLSIAVGAIFVFGGEPWTAWLFMLAGPLLTLPAALLSLYQREAAGYFLIIGAVVSFGALVLDALGEEESLGIILRSLKNVQGPMLALAVGFLFLYRIRERSSG